MTDDFSTEAILVCKDLCKTWDNDSRPVKAIHYLDLVVRKGEFVVVTGPSGCGKSTAQQVFAGLTPSTSGTILVDNQTVTGPETGGCLVFQEPKLFEWFTVLGNVEFGLRMNSVSANVRIERSKKMLEAVGLAEFANHSPRQLSSGMKQRVALARGLVMRKPLLLLDEPFASLDDPTKVDMHKLLLNIWEQTKQTIIMVTHSISEAVLLADRIVLLSARPGRVKKIFPVKGSRPRDIYSKELVDLSREIEASLAEEVKSIETPPISNDIGETKWVETIQ